VKRQYRITRSNDFKRVRQNGKAYTHPLVLILVMPTPGDQKRIGIIAGKSIGNAVQRNLVKRRIRSVADELLQKINIGVDMLMITKPSIKMADYSEIREAIIGLCKKANIVLD
jgi:ribonuclease P protein component